jgi:23S rRNA pseudouridine1911/1915/1917 synthase
VKRPRYVPAYGIYGRMGKRSGHGDRAGATPCEDAARNESKRSWSGIVVASGASRADVYIAEVVGVLSRSQLKARGAEIRVNGAIAKLSRPLRGGDRLDLAWTDQPHSGLQAEVLPITVIYEDERCIAIDKAQGMVVHPGAGNRSGTLANALLGRAERSPRAGAAAGDPALPAPASRGPAERGGIVHRLDKDTSGVIVAAKDLEAQVFLAAQFKDRLAKKEYMAVTRGVPNPSSGRIADRLGRDKRDRKRFSRVESGGKAALTDYRVIAAWGGSYALVSLRPKTGRTHQLRVHMSGLGAPILGDPIYGRRDPRFPAATLMLHARRLRISLPGGGGEVEFAAPVPDRFREVVKALNAAFGPGDRPGRSASG